VKHLRTIPILLAALVSCASSPERVASLECWGEMRNVLREGNTEGRVRIEGVARPGTWGVGAMEGLEGEITIYDGNVVLAIVEDEQLTLREATKRDQATLLVLATVDEWRVLGIPEVRNAKDLEYALARALEATGFDPSIDPVPIRIEAEFPSIALHVLDHSCPIANPEGPPPWRYYGENVTGTLVGIYAEGQAGTLTHHGQNFHLHAVIRTEDGTTVSGHMDEVALGTDAQLFLPVRAPER
jgi:alpha-acetolactate decarboxylase